jgi:hypothetical protein
MVVQGSGNWLEYSGGPIKTEADPPDALPARTTRPSFEAIRSMGSTVLGLTDSEAQVRGAANDRAKRELPWRLPFPAGRDGSRLGLA